MRNWLIVPTHPPLGQVQTGPNPPEVLNAKPEMRYSFALLPVGNANTVPLDETLHVAPFAQINVTPLESENGIVLLQV